MNINYQEKVPIAVSMREMHWISGFLTYANYNFLLTLKVSIKHSGFYYAFYMCAMPLCFVLIHAPFSIYFSIHGE